MFGMCEYICYKAIKKNISINEHYPLKEKYNIELIRSKRLY